MAASKGCWTCKDRKVSCDRMRPKCLKCRTGKRVCAGYGMRLTWQKVDGLNKRFLQSRIKINDGHNTDESFQFVNVVPADIRLHLSATGFGTSVTRSRKNQLTLPTATDLSLDERKHSPNSDDDLLQYFETKVMNLLPTTFVNRSKLLEYIMRSARSNQGPSSRAVFYSVLALASHHRGDQHASFDQFHQIAISQLRAQPYMTTCQAAHHIVANMLLCILAMQITERCNSAWLGHMCSVKDIMHVFGELAPSASEYTPVILGWAYHFDIMVRFSIRHWRTDHIKPYVEELGFTDVDYGEDCVQQYLFVLKAFAKRVPDLTAHAHPLLQIIAEVSGTLMNSNPGFLSDEYQTYLDELRRRLRNVRTNANSEDVTPEKEFMREDAEIELTQLAAQIYFERVSKSFSGQSTQIQLWFRAAMSKLKILESCTASFALFIIGCEAIDDQDRMVILQLYARTQTQPHLSHIANSKSLVETAWNHRDLQEDGEVDYIRMLNLVMSTRDVVPSLI